MERTIDYVFPYVDCDDPQWIEEYNKYAPKKRNENKWGTDMQRFRSNDLLKYTFRSIEKNMPFIRKVHLIVMSDSQVPDWINRDTVNIIYHKDYIPEKFLPTFNSNTIESFLANLPEVSDRFIYGNDDLFITSKCSESDFFSGNTPKYTMKKRGYIPSAPGDGLRYDDKKLLTGKNDKTVYEVQHICMPYVMETIREVYETYKKEILASIGKFREPGQYNQWIYSIYQSIKKKKHINKGIKYLSTEINPVHKSKYMVDWTKYKAICLNDSCETRQSDLSYVRNKLEKMFPTPSKYEKIVEKKKTDKPEKPVKNKPQNGAVQKPKKKSGSKAGRPGGRGWCEFFGMQ